MTLDSWDLTDMNISDEDISGVITDPASATKFVDGAERFINVTLQLLPVALLVLQALRPSIAPPVKTVRSKKKSNQLSL